MNWQGNTPFPILKPARFINRDRFLWMLDDDKGIFACVDGLRPVIMLIEVIEESQK